MIDDKTAGQPMIDVAGRREEAGGAIIEVTTIVLQPKDFRTDGLRGQGVAAAIEDPLAPMRLSRLAISAAAHVSTP